MPLLFVLVYKIVHFSVSINKLSTIFIYKGDKEGHIDPIIGL